MVSGSFVLNWILFDKDGKVIECTNSKEEIVPAVFRCKVSTLPKIKKENNATEAREVTKIKGVWTETGRVV